MASSFVIHECFVLRYNGVHLNYGLLLLKFKWTFHSTVPMTTHLFSYADNFLNCGILQGGRDVLSRDNDGNFFYSKL